MNLHWVRGMTMINKDSSCTEAVHWRRSTLRDDTPNIIIANGRGAAVCLSLWLYTLRGGQQSAAAAAAHVMSQTCRISVIIIRRSCVRNWQRVLARLWDCDVAATTRDASSITLWEPASGIVAQTKGYHLIVSFSRASLSTRNVRSHGMMWKHLNLHLCWL